MREVEGETARSDGGALDGRSGLRAPRRRRAVLVAMLTLVAAGGAVAAVAGPGLTLRPASSVERAADTAGSPGSPGPASTAAAIAVARATAGPTADPTHGATPAAAPTPDPTGAPTPGVHAPAGSPAPVPCNAAGTAGGAVRPCPPPPCRDPATTAPSGAMAPNLCPPPPCMEPMAASPAPADPVRPCPPPPCRWTMAGSDSVTAGPCPPPCGPWVAPQASPAASPMLVRACPQPQPWVMLTERDSGRTITVHAGTRIVVRLAGGGVWTEPTTSDGAVVTRISSSHDSQGDAAGDFRAARAGNADLTATDSPRCAPQCKAMSRLWVVHIVVVA